MEKARQIIYSVLMGFTLKYFLEHLMSVYPEILKLDFTNRLFYFLILFYFIVNTFRYLFGILSFSLMMDKDYSIKKIDWKKGNIWFNFQRTYVLNSGIFIVVAFASLAILLFPSSNESFNPSDIHPETGKIIVSRIYSLNGTALGQIVKNFMVLNLIILIFDFISSFLFNKTAPKTDTTYDEDEKLQCYSWMLAGGLEIIIFLVLTGVYFSQDSINHIVNFSIITILIGVMFLEVFGFWQYRINGKLGKGIKDLIKLYKSTKENKDDVAAS